MVRRKILRGLNFISKEERETIAPVFCIDQRIIIIPSVSCPTPFSQVQLSIQVLYVVLKGTPEIDPATLTTLKKQQYKHMRASQKVLGLSNHLPVPTFVLLNSLQILGSDIGMVILRGIVNVPLPTLSYSIPPLWLSLPCTPVCSLPLTYPKLLPQPSLSPPLSLFRSLIYTTHSHQAILSLHSNRKGLLWVQRAVSLNRYWAGVICVFCIHVLVLGCICVHALVCACAYLCVKVSERYLKREREQRERE